MKLVKSYPSLVGKIRSDAGKQGTCQVIAMEYEHQRGLNSLMQGAYQFLNINLRPFLRRFKTDFSEI